MLIFRDISLHKLNKNKFKNNKLKVDAISVTKTLNSLVEYFINHFKSHDIELFRTSSNVSCQILDVHFRLY